MSTQTAATPVIVATSSDVDEITLAYYEGNPDDKHDKNAENVAYDLDAANAWLANVAGMQSAIAQELLNGFRGHVQVPLGFRATPAGFAAMCKARLAAAGLRFSKAQREAFALTARGIFTNVEIAMITGVSDATISRFFTYQDTGEKPTAKGVTTRKDGTPGAGAGTDDANAPADYLAMGTLALRKLQHEGDVEGIAKLRKLAEDIMAEILINA